MAKEKIPMKSEICPLIAGCDTVNITYHSHRQDFIDHVCSKEYKSCPDFKELKK
jgi:hypothetical protein